MKRKDFKCLYPFLITLFLAFSLFSCNQQKTSAAEIAEPGEVEALKQDLMIVHDETMPRIGTLIHLKKQLKKKVAQLDTAADAGSKDKAAALLLAIKGLEEADEAMMQWMRTYQDPEPSMGKAEALEYLQLKRQEILLVKEQMAGSETAAKSML